jgi:hypothetical protein
VLQWLRKGQPHPGEPEQVARCSGSAARSARNNSLYAFARYWSVAFVALLTGMGTSHRRPAVPSGKKETNGLVAPLIRSLYLVAVRSPAVPHIVFQSVPTIWTTPTLSTRGPIPYAIHRRYKPNCPHNWGLVQARSQPWQRKRSRLSDRRNVAHCRPCTCRADPRRERNIRFIPKTLQPMDIE